MYDYIGLNCLIIALLQSRENKHNDKKFLLPETKKGQKNNSDNNNDNNKKIPNSKQCGKLSLQILRYKMSL